MDMVLNEIICVCNCNVEILIVILNIFLLICIVKNFFNMRIRGI